MAEQYSFPVVCKDDYVVERNHPVPSNQSGGLYDIMWYTYRWSEYEEKKELTPSHKEEVTDEK